MLAVKLMQQSVCMRDVAVAGSTQHRIRVKSHTPGQTQYNLSMMASRWALDAHHDSVSEPEAEELLLASLLLRLLAWI